MRRAAPHVVVGQIGGAGVGALPIELGTVAAKRDLLRLAPVVARHLPQADVGGDRTNDRLARIRREIAPLVAGTVVVVHTAIRDLRVGASAVGDRVRGADVVVVAVQADTGDRGGVRRAELAAGAVVVRRTAVGVERMPALLPDDLLGRTSVAVVRTGDFAPLVDHAVAGLARTGLVVPVAKLGRSRIERVGIGVVTVRTKTADARAGAVGLGAAAFGGPSVAVGVGAVELSAIRSDTQDDRVVVRVVDRGPASGTGLDGVSRIATHEDGGRDEARGQP